MTHWTDRLQLTADDPIFSVSEVAVLVGVIGQRGISAHSVLSTAGINDAMMGDPSARISLKQQCLAQEVGAALYGDTGVLVRQAKRLHLTAYGIAGYALLSSADLNNVIRVAELYSPLLSLKFSLELRTTAAQARLCFVDRYFMDSTMRRSCAVLELAKAAMLLRDVLGGDFKPHAAICSGADATQLAELSELLGCQVTASGDATEIRFDASLLTRTLPQSNAATHATCLRVCDTLMASLASNYDIERQVKDIIFKATDRTPTLPEVASELCVSQRTLRRRLDALNTSYNQILEEVRKALAVRYLTTTQFTTEAIAQLVGYSEAANFRHAFKRWTGTSPTHFRASWSDGVARPPIRTAAQAGRSVVPCGHSFALADADACWA